MLVLEGRNREEKRREEMAAWEGVSLEEHMARYESQGLDRKEAM